MMSRLILVVSSMAGSIIIPSVKADDPNVTNTTISEIETWTSTATPTETATLTETGTVTVTPSLADVLDLTGDDVTDMADMVKRLPSYAVKLLNLDSTSALGQDVATNVKIAAAQSFLSVVGMAASSFTKIHVWVTSGSTPSSGSKSSSVRRLQGLETRLPAVVTVAVEPVDPAAYVTVRQLIDGKAIEISVMTGKAVAATPGIAAVATGPVTGQPAAVVAPVVVPVVVAPAATGSMPANPAAAMALQINQGLLNNDEQGAEVRDDRQFLKSAWGLTGLSMTAFVLVGLVVGMMKIRSPIGSVVHERDPEEESIINE